MAKLNYVPLEPWELQQLNGGICLEDLEMKLLDNQSPYMVDMWFIERILRKRWGQNNLFSPVASAPIYQVYNELYDGHIIFHCGTKLYKLNLTTDVATEIYSGVPENKGTFFNFNDILYYKNVGAYIQWNGTAAAVPTPYIPTVFLNRTDAGGGDLNEDFNRIGAGFIYAFETDGVDTVFPLEPLLDVTAITGSLDAGVTFDKVETTHFTVNRTTGAVTWLVAPPAGTNAMRLKAYKTDATVEATIDDCKFALDFGGRNDSRVFLAGNGTNNIYFSGLLDPTYFPESNFKPIGSSGDIYGLGEQYDVLIAFKEYEIFGVEYDADQSTLFSSYPINRSVGCDMPWTIQLINNKLTWCNSYAGVHTLVSTEIEDERNVQQISRNINGTTARPGMLAESNLANATSYDYKGMYWLCVGTKVWVWDYLLTPYVSSGNPEADQKVLAWFPLTNINAECFFDYGGTLYYGDRTTGKVVEFIENKNDFGNAINGVWRTKVLDFGLSNWLKTIIKMWFTTNATVGADINIRYLDDNGDELETIEVPAGQTNSFSWATFTWSAFTWNITRYAKTIYNNNRINKKVYFQIEFSNNVLNEDLAIMDLKIQYRKDKEVKQ
jgi:hypothetical protein